MSNNTPVVQYVDQLLRERYAELPKPGKTALITLYVCRFGSSTHRMRHLMNTFIKYPTPDENEWFAAWVTYYWQSYFEPEKAVKPAPDAAPVLDEHFSPWKGTKTMQARLKTPA